MPVAQHEVEMLELPQILRSCAGMAGTVAVAAALLGCGGQKDQTKQEGGAAAGGESASADPVQEQRSASAVIERIDINNDRKPDVFKHYALVDEPAGDGKGGRLQRKVLIRKEIDVNFDQRLDIVEYYKGESGKEIKEREEFDLDFDGRVDEIRKYDNGTLIEMQLDLGFDGRIDTWMFYQMTKNEDGKDVNRLNERRRDENGDGVLDSWEYYVKGKLQKVGRDTNGDGQPDMFTRVDDKK